MSNINKKISVVNKIKHIIKHTKLLIVADFNGIKAADMNIVRKQARTSDVYVYVMRNTLIKKAIQKTQFECIIHVNPVFYGQSIIFASVKKLNAAACIIRDLRKVGIDFTIKSAVTDNIIVSSHKMKYLESIANHKDALVRLLYVIKESIVIKLIKTFKLIHSNKNYSCIQK